MKSGYIEGSTIPSFDSKIAAFLSEERISGNEGNMVTAIQNVDRKVYRIIYTEGLGEYIQLVSFLSDLGLTDQLADSMDGKNGYDSFFIVPQNS